MSRRSKQQAAKALARMGRQPELSPHCEADSLPAPFEGSRTRTGFVQGISMSRKEVPQGAGGEMRGRRNVGFTGLRPHTDLPLPDVYTREPFSPSSEPTLVPILLGGKPHPTLPGVLVHCQWTEKNPAMQYPTPESAAPKFPDYGYYRRGVLRNTRYHAVP